jgi:hypothetical protein
MIVQPVEEYDESEFTYVDVELPVNLKPKCRASDLKIENSIWIVLNMSSQTTFSLLTDSPKGN